MHFLALNGYDRHKKLVNNYLMYYGGRNSDFARDSSKDKRDIDVIRENHQFLWDEDDDDDDDDMVDTPAEHGDEDCSESEEEQEEMANIDSQTETMTEAGDEDYDAKHVNFAAEVDALEALKNARVDSMFPDEVDTPQVLFF